MWPVTYEQQRSSIWHPPCTTAAHLAQGGVSFASPPLPPEDSALQWGVQTPSLGTPCPRLPPPHSVLSSCRLVFIVARVQACKLPQEVTRSATSKERWSPVALRRRGRDPRRGRGRRERIRRRRAEGCGRRRRRRKSAGHWRGAATDRHRALAPLRAGGAERRPRGASSVHRDRRRPALWWWRRPALRPRRRRYRRRRWARDDGDADDARALLL